MIEMNPWACYRRCGMQTEDLAIVRPPATGDQELASRLAKGLEDASHVIAMYSSPELRAMSAKDLSGTALLVVSPGQCIDTSGDEPAFLSKVARAQKRILASVGRADSPGYRGRLNRGISFDAVLDLGFASQRDRHIEVSDVAYHFVFNGPTPDEEPLTEEPANPEERTIPWVLVGPKSESNRDLLGELFEQGFDPEGFCLLQARVLSKSMAHPLLGSQGLSAVLSKARFYLWSADREAAYYESFRFIEPLLAGTVPCKIEPDLAAEGPDIPGVYPSVSALQAEIRDEGYLAMYRRARDFYISGGRLAKNLTEALRLV
jgi:hypothetical protein